LGIGGAIVLSASVAYVQTQQGAANPLVGVWRLQETTGANATREPTMRGLHIFTKQHYSTVRLAESAPNVPAGKLSDAQKAALFDALTVDTGSYEVKGNIMTRHSIASKTPATAATAPITEFKVEGNQLYLYPRPNGQPASPTNYLKYTRVE
jgi:hypothetical protein